tara:strand:+ start:1769 stop:2713 length:945 start_codon:yes stop_codon:yes gene_type:complete
MNDLVKKDPKMQFAKEIASSNLVPQQFRGKPADIYLAMSWGDELGLSPIQSLQNIAVINGKPSIYGDTMIALCRRHPEFEDIKETISGEGSARTAVCEIKRKGQSWYKSQFTMGEAAKAGLLNRPGPWKSYPDRMLKMRARGFALRDVFADALGGMISAEEAQDYPKSSIKDITPVSKQLDNLSKKPIDEPGEASKAKDDTTIGKGKLGHSEAPMAQEQDTQPEDDKSPWDMRRLKGPAVYCEDPKSFAEEFMNNMNKIKNHKTTSKQKKLEFLKQLLLINDDTLKEVDKVDSGLHTSIWNEYMTIAGELGGKQ